MMTRDAVLAWIRAHETDSNEQAAQALLALLDEETAGLRAHYRKRERAQHPLSLEPALIGTTREGVPEAYLWWGNDVSWFIQLHCARTVVDSVEAVIRALAGTP